MARRDQPYIPLYVQDFLTDEKLIECSAESTGVYIRLMCIMHKSQEYGTILLKQKDKQTPKQNTEQNAEQREEQIRNFAQKIAKQMPYDLPTIERGLTELLEEGVLTMDGDTLYQKRMVKDGETSDKRSISGKKGGKKSAGRKKASNDSEAPDSKFASNFAQAKSEANTQANSENEIENESEGENKTENEENKGKKGGGKKGKKRSSTDRPEPDKIAYAEFVHMTETEHQTLLERFGPEKTARMIEILDNYKGSSGKRYQSDYRAILNWVVERAEQERGQGGGGGHGGFERGTPDSGYEGFKPSEGFRRDWH